MTDTPSELRVTVRGAPDFSNYEVVDVAGSGRDVPDFVRSLDWVERPAPAGFHFVRFDRLGADPNPMPNFYITPAFVRRLGDRWRVLVDRVRYGNWQR